MGGQLSLAEGKYLVQLARKTLEHYFRTGQKKVPENEEGVLGEARGVFVTLHTFPAMELRGCIGYPLPIKQLARAVVDNALSAGFEDPRFPQLSEDELEKIVIEVSVLTVPEKLKNRGEKRADEVQVGRDGLIMRAGYTSGLLLPQVAPEWGWNARQFLSQTCNKAGLPGNCWLQDNVEVLKFQAQIFTEEKPNGKILEKKIGD